MLPALLARAAGLPRSSARLLRSFGHAGVIPRAASEPLRVCRHLLSRSVPGQITRSQER